ncbi:NlpC/P60 family protein, partial [Streptomyces sp.]|uniref:C40 family peptidase n=1 Tax=Streptomyces sp. TaxID=1931 RepID=UPI002810AA51
TAPPATAPAAGERAPGGPPARKPAPGEGRPAQAPAPAEPPPSDEPAPGEPPPAAPPGAEPAPGEPSSPAEPPAGDDDAAALPPSGGDSVATLLTRLRTLYRQAEEATERYNATAEALKLQTADTKKVTAGLTATREALARARDEAGRLAREQYQGRSALSPALRLLLAPDPRAALDQGHLMARAARDRATTVSRLRDAERRAGTLAAASAKALERQRELTARQRTEHAQVMARLREVERLLASLSPAQLTRLTELERAQTAGAQRTLLDSGVLDGVRTPSRAGAAALRFAVDRIGTPYAWGAEGPDAYDCSGLTRQAWAAAGRDIPRTSQEQWARLPRVPLAELRPGDLVVYFPGATHVALYLGEGLVVHAPRPGGRVKVSPVAANPLLGAVRPDPDGTALPSYVPPRLPAGARDGADEGYDATA